MATVTAPSAIPDSETKIGDARHPVRNAGLAIGAVAVGVLLFGYYRSVDRQETTQFATLQRFAALYSTRCNAPELTTDGDALVRRLYLNSPALQQTIAEQMAALEGGASCADVSAVLRKADFPLVAKSP